MMNPLSQSYYTNGSGADFLGTLFLSEEKNLRWDALSESVPDLPRGWFELSQISKEDRLEFIRDFWLERLPFQPRAHDALSQFFAKIDDIGIVIVTEEAGKRPEMVYSLADNSTFFRGLPPAGDEDIREFQAQIPHRLPRDYLSFLKIHNGFGKLSEIEILQMDDVGPTRHRIYDLLFNANPSITSNGRVVDPSSLIPFYEAMGLSSFQCFFADWYPGSEMGNVYLSGLDATLSDTQDRTAWLENLAFMTFSEWLSHYLEGMSLCT